MFKYFELATKFLPTILGLMGIAEKLFDGKPDSGAEKKAMVTAAAKAVIGSVQSVSTGGQAETWDRIADPVSNIIDAAAAIAFPEHKSK